MGTTPRLALPFPEDADAVDVPGDVEALADALDGAAVTDRGSLVARPVSTPGSPGIVGRLYIVSDEGDRLDVDYGTGWVTTGEVADNAITQAKLADNSVGANEVIADSIGQSELAPDSVGALEIIDASVAAAEIAAALKPSGTAVGATEALRALGTSASMAAAGNDSRLSDARAPTDGSVTTAKLAASPALKVPDSNLLSPTNGNWKLVHRCHCVVAGGSMPTGTPQMIATDGTLIADGVASAKIPSSFWFNDATFDVGGNTHLIVELTAQVNATAFGASAGVTLHQVDGAGAGGSGLLSTAIDDSGEGSSSADFASASLVAGAVLRDLSGQINAQNDNLFVVGVKGSGAGSAASRIVLGVAVWTYST